MQILIFFVLFACFLIGFNLLMGYRKNYITIDLDERYIDFNQYVKAIQEELVKGGRDVHYTGDRKFMIDGKAYLFIERNVSMGGVPLQRTILKPEKVR